MDKTRPRAYKVVDFRIPVEIGTVRVRPEMFFRRRDGVLLVPAEAETEVFHSGARKGSRRKAGKGRPSRKEAARRSVREIWNHVKNGESSVRIMARGLEAAYERLASASTRQHC